MRALVLVSLIAMATYLPAHARAQGSGECANTRASQVDARTVWDGDVVRCGLGFKLFGIGGGIFGPRCPDRKLHYPSHQVCNGESSPGNYCAPAGNLDVSAEDCQCERALVLGTGFLFPSCSCSTSPHDGGHVEDAQTLPCRVDA